MKQKRKTHAQTLNDNAEAVIDCLQEGGTYDDLKKMFGVSYESISAFINKSEYSARVKDAQKNSAQKYAKLALDSLIAIKTGDDKADITRQRELAHHYRWLAKVKSPREFNENRVDTDELAAKLLAPTIILKKE